MKNTASASGTGPLGQLGTAPEVEVLVDLPGYAINKMVSLSEVRRGDSVPYTILAKMFGLSDPTTVNIVVMTPPGVTFVLGSAMRWCLD